MTENSDNQCYERFIAYRNAQLEIEKHNIVTFDKAIATMSPGALGLSLVFIDKIGGSSSAEWKILLLFSWGTYLISIISNLLSFRFGWREARDERIRRDKHLRTKANYNFPDNEKTSCANLCNEIALWSFCIATAFLGIFAYINMGT